MKKSVLVVLIVILLTISAVNALVEPGVISNPCKDGFIDFENGVEGQAVSSSIPGVVFTNTGGLDWVYGDKHFYNVAPYGSANYVTNGIFFGWLGNSGSQGKIAFSQGCATYVSALVSTSSGVQIDAFDINNNPLATSGIAGSNIDTGTMTRLTVNAPGISYVVVHDTGNYWLIDDICTDAAGVNPTPAPEFPSALLPITFVIGFLGIVLIIRKTKNL